MTDLKLEVLNRISQMESRIMATQAEVVVELRDSKVQLQKIKQEVVDAKNDLAATIKRLEDVIAAGNTGEASADLVSIKDELKVELQAFDDLHADKPVTPV